METSVVILASSPNAVGRSWDAHADWQALVNSLRSILEPSISDRDDSNE